jgi:aminopeptidase N
VARSPLLLFALVVACAGHPAAVPAAAPPGAVETPFVPTPPTLRLPLLARPSRYDLDLTLDPRSPAFSGRVGVDVEVIAPTRVLWLNATDLTIDEVKLELGGTTETAKIVPALPDFVGLVFHHELAAGKGRLSIAYRGAIDQEKSRGIYAAREGDGEPYLYTFFEPTDARRAFPCFDEPLYKVPWKLTLRVPAGNVALANAPVATERTEGATKVVEMTESKPMPSYLVAFVVGPFDVVDAGTAGHAGTPLRFVVPKGRGAETAYAAKVTPKIVGLLEDYFDMSYPFGKLDVAVVPRYWGTMEHPGIVAMGQSLTLILPPEETVEREQSYANIVAHELAHYWFGDYVTAAWWDDTWLNEALGTWMDETITERAEPTWGYDLERIDRTARGMSSDALTSAKKIRQPVASKDDIENAFDANITYYKGQAVLSMLEAYMTPERFQTAIRAYMGKYSWKNATAEDFFAALDGELRGAGASLASFVDQPGIPSITIEADCHGPFGGLNVRQHRYQALGAAVSPESWKVPVCVRYAYGKNAAPERICTMLTSESITIPLESRECPIWLVGNAEGSGYYHVAYTPAQLGAALAAKAPTTLAERVGALHDAAALVASGDLSIADALALVPGTASSRNRHVVDAGLDLVEFAPDAAMNDGEATQRARFLRRVYGPKARELGLTHRADDGIDGQLLRPRVFRVVAVSGEDPDLRKRAHDLAALWLKDEHAVPAELVGAVLEAAAKSNDEKLFLAIVEKANTEKDHRKVAKLLRALGAFTSPALVEKADAIVAGTTFDVRDTFGILFAQFDDRAAREPAWTFVKSAFDSVSQRLRSDEVLFRFFALTTSFCDEAHKRDVESFFSARASRFDGGTRAAANAVEGIGQCAATFTKNQASLDAFLKK